jgi:hypothetical protein
MTKALLEKRSLWTICTWQILQSDSSFNQSYSLSHPPNIIRHPSISWLTPSGRRRATCCSSNYRYVQLHTHHIAMLSATHDLIKYFDLSAWYINSSLSNCTASISAATITSTAIFVDFKLSLLILSCLVYNCCWFGRVIVVVILCVLLYWVFIAVFLCNLDAGLLARSQ